MWIAEEITQEAFFRAFRSFQVFRQESSFFTRIYKITLNVARSFLKKKAKQPIPMRAEEASGFVGEMIDPDPARNPEMAVLANEIRVRCLHCFTECLPVNQRIVFCLAVTIPDSAAKNEQYLQAAFALGKELASR